MKTLRIFTMFALSCALLSCGNEKDGDISQLPSPKVIQDEAKTTKTSVAAFWTEVAGAASYNVIFDDRDVVSTTEKEMAWDNLETNSTHTLKVQAVSADKNAFKDSEWSVAVLTTGHGTRHAVHHEFPRRHILQCEGDRQCRQLYRQVFLQCYT